MGVVDAYLIVYNLGCMFGWLYALLLAAQSLVNGGDLAGVWSAMGMSIHAAQWAMAMEMLHSLTGMVKSPFVPTFLQVVSRLGLMVVVMLSSPAVSATWHCGMMAISWSLVEVPRYAFYLNGLLKKEKEDVLYPIFWLRYSLFAVLYPTGITGEILTMVASLSDPTFALAVGGIMPLVVKLNLGLYVPGSPFMYMNMVKNRKGAFKKRYPPPLPPLKEAVGAEFPEDGLGGRSTSVRIRGPRAPALVGRASGQEDAPRACRLATSGLDRVDPPASRVDCCC